MIIKRHNKKKKRSKVQQMLGYGSAPQWKGKVKDEGYRMAYVKVLNWISATMNVKAYRKEFVNYCGTAKINLKKFKEIKEDWRFSNVGTFAWLKNNNWPLTDESEEWYAEKMGELKERSEEAWKEALAKKRTDARLKKKMPPLLTPAEKEAIKRDEIHADIDYAYVDQSVFVSAKDAVLSKDPDFTYKILQVAKLKPHSVEIIVSAFQAKLDELHLINHDEQVTEGYENFTKSDIVRQRKWLKEIIEQCQSVVQNKKAKKPRKKKLRTADMIVKNIKFRQADSDLKLESIDPATIVGADSLLIYNTKSRRIGLYRAKDSEGLTVRGTTIKNFNIDLKKSRQKILRKPKEQLTEFRRGTRKRCEVMLDKNIKGKVFSLNGRLNAETILLKVFK